MKDGGPARLVAILNSFNRRELLRDALASLAGALADCPFGAAIVVFDAGSTDGSLEWLAEYREERPRTSVQVILREEGADGSLSAGVNAAARFSLEKFPDLEWLFLFETDNWIGGATPVLAAVNLLYSVPDLAAAGFTVKKRGGEDAGFGCAFPTVTQFILGQRITNLLRLDTPRIGQWQVAGNVRWAPCDIVYTSPLLIRRKAWEQIGGPDARSFPFCDMDVDWSWRASREGWRMAVVETSEIVHDNIGVASEWSAGRVVNFHRARLRLLSKYRKMPLLLVKILLLCRHLFELFMLILASWCLDNPRRILRDRWVLLKSALWSYER
jgi:GT2 family glycosyltransferase